MRSLTRIISTVMLVGLLMSSIARAQAIGDKIERVARAKRASVRIYVDGKPNGSGFIVSGDGLIVTAFHVLFKEYIGKDDTQIMQSDVEVEFNDGTKLPAVIHKVCLVKDTTDKGTDEAFYDDFCILQTNPKARLEVIPLGSFATASEGADIYICGFPSDFNKPLVNFGVMSTKAKILFTIRDNVIIPQPDKGKTDVAWMDITLNRGDSGAPVIVMGKKPKDDRVIGIVSINRSPLPPELMGLIQEFNRRLQQAASSARYNPLPMLDSLYNPNRNTKLMSDEDIAKLANLVGAGLLSSSLGYGACVSIDNVKEKIASLAIKHH